MVQVAEPAPVRKPSGSDADWLKEFELTERSGKLVSSESLKGQPYVLSFFFSTCPTICKRQNEKVSQIQKKFKGNLLDWLALPAILKSTYLKCFRSMPMALTQIVSNGCS